MSTTNIPPKPPVVFHPSTNAVLVNPVQRLNPVMEHIRNVQYQFAEIVPDFQLGATTCALYLSLKYHRLHPEYVHKRIENLGHMYGLRILLILCDITEHQETLRELTKICIINTLTVMVAWSPEEAGTYLSTYKIFEQRAPDSIKERVDKDYTSMLRNALTSIRGINKTDVTTLRTNFGSVADMSKATPEQLLLCPGFGQVKVRRLREAFDKPFHVWQRSSVSSTAARPPSPVWDIELDLNDSDAEEIAAPPPTKKRKPNEPTETEDSA